jgi:hypothetical protein
MTVERGLRADYLMRARTLRHLAKEVKDKRAKAVLLFAARDFELIAEGEQPEPWDLPPRAN